MESSYPRGYCRCCVPNAEILDRGWRQVWQVHLRHVGEAVCSIPTGQEAEGGESRSVRAAGKNKGRKENLPWVCCSCLKQSFIPVRCSVVFVKWPGRAGHNQCLYAGCPGGDAVAGEVLSTVWFPAAAPAPRLTWHLLSIIAVHSLMAVSGGYLPAHQKQNQINVISELKQIQSEEYVGIWFFFSHVSVIK